MARTRKGSAGEGKDVQADKGPSPRTPVPKETDSGVVRIEGDIAYKLGVLSSLLRRLISDIISPVLRPIIEKLYADAIKSAASAVEGKQE